MPIAEIIEYEDLKSSSLQVPAQDMEVISAAFACQVMSAITGKQYVIKSVFSIDCS